MSDNEDDIDFGESTTQFKQSFILIAIDVDPSMFIKTEDGTPFKNCITACSDLANSLIFTQNKRSWSPFGIVLAKEDASASFVNFQDNVLDTIKFLKGKKEASDDDLETLHQRKGNLDLSAFFLFCKKKFKEVNSVFYKRTIIYITNDDNPVKNDKNQRFAALNEAKNFEANGISFEMVTINPDFDYKLFYNELFSVMKVPLVETIVEDSEGLFEKLSSLILVKFYQRKLFFFPFLGDESRFLTVDQKAFIRDEKIYNNAAVSTDGKTLKKVFKDVISSAKKYVLKQSMCDVEFDLEDYMEIMENNLPIGYTLICVSDRVTEIGSVLKDSKILEPNLKEDLTFFNSFWQYCVDKDKVLICARKLRQLDNLRFVEFIPKFANNNRIFLIKAIPYKNETRNTEIGEDENENYSAAKLTVVNQLIENLTFDYNPKMFTHPCNAKKKAFLTSKLLDEPKEDVEDVTLDKDGIDQNLANIRDDFVKIFNLDVEVKGARKRKTAASDGRAKKKK